MKVYWSNDDNAVAFADGKIEEWYQSRVLNDTSSSIVISTSIQFTRLRLGLVEGDFDNLELIVDNRSYAVHENGSLPVWPDELNVSDELLMKLLDARDPNRFFYSNNS